MAASKRYILYADDDIDDRELFEEQFAAIEDINLLTFINGQELLQYLQAPAPGAEICLVVADINMPQLTGVELLALVRADKSLSHIPFVLFSTAGSPSDKSTADRFGADIVTKPTNTLGVSHMVETLLRYCR